MTDKVQKIREEVEWLKSQLLRGACSSQIAMETRCKEEAYNEVLAILDTMQEEPKECIYSKDDYTDEDRKILCAGCEEDCKYNKKKPVAPKVLEDMLNAKTPAENLGISAEEHDRIVDELIYGKEPELVDVDDLPTKKDYRERYKRITESEEFRKNHDGMSIGDIVPVEGEKPVSEDFDALDQLLAKYAIDFSYKGKTLKECSGRYKAEIITIANHLEPVSEELEEAADNALNNVLNTHEIVNIRSCLEMFRFGANWKQQQMMAKAIDGTAKLDYNDIWCNLSSSNLKDGDKVKIVIIKEG